MIPRPLRWTRYLFALIAVGLFGVRPAAAEIRSVNCSTGNVNTELQAFANRSTPNVLNVSGICDQDVNIIAFTSLTVQGPGSLWRNVSIQNSTVLLKTLLINFNQTSAPFATLNLTQSTVMLDGVTVENSLHNHGVVVGPNSVLNFGPTNPSAITGNGGSGIYVDAGSVRVANVTISNNGSDPGWGSVRNGIRIDNGGHVVLANRVNGVATNVDIFGNHRQGIALDTGGTLDTDAESNLGTIHIHDNGDVGVEVDGGAAHINGHVQIDNNATSGCSLDGSAVATTCDLVAFAGTMNIEDGAQIGNAAVVFNASAAITPGAGTPVNISGSLLLGFGSIVALFGPSTINDLECDDTSWSFRFDGGGPGATIGTDNCPVNVPRGGIGPKGDKGDTGDTGAQGPQGIQGPPGVSGLQRVTAQANLTLAKNQSSGVTATCPAGTAVIGGAAGTGNPAFAIISSGPGPNATTQWSANFWNTGNNSTRAVSVTAICATAP
jgi:hypothetical protein